jgi:hypothetical protein
MREFYFFDFFLERMELEEEVYILTHRCLVRPRGKHTFFINADCGVVVVQLVLCVAPPSHCVYSGIL